MALQDINQELRSVGTQANAIASKITNYADDFPDMTANQKTGAKTIVNNKIDVLISRLNQVKTDITAL